MSPTQPKSPDAGSFPSAKQIRDEMDRDFRKAVGSRISDARLERDMSQAELAKAANLSQAMISRLENGGTWASGETLFRITAALGLHPQDLTEHLTEENLADAPAEYIWSLNGATMMQSREAAKHSREDLARATSASTSLITSIETGNEPISDSLKLEVCNVLGVPPEGVAPLAYSRTAEPPDDTPPPTPPGEGLTAGEFMQKYEAAGNELSRRERYYLATSQFDTESWFIQDEEFWTDLLEFWRKQIARNQ